MSRKPVKFEINPLLSGPSLEARTRTGSPYREVPIGDIDVDPDQPRRTFESEALGELANSIKQHGILSPLLVRVSAGGTYRLIAGERRLRAAKIAGLESVPVVVYQKDDSQPDTLSKQLVENLQRQDLSSMEKAIAIGQLRDQHQWSLREIASNLGVSKGQVQRSVEVLSLPDDLHAALISGAQESKVLLLGKVDNRELRKALLGKIDSLTRDELEVEIEKILTDSGKSLYRRGTDSKSKQSLSDKNSDDSRIISDIQRRLGTKVFIKRKRGKGEQGRITVEFYSPDDLQEIYKRLSE